MVIVFKLIAVHIWQHGLHTPQGVEMVLMAWGNNVHAPWASNLADTVAMCPLLYYKMYSYNFKGVSLNWLGIKNINIIVNLDLVQNMQITNTCNYNNIAHISYKYMYLVFLLLLCIFLVMKPRIPLKVYSNVAHNPEGKTMNSVSVSDVEGKPQTNMLGKPPPPPQSTCCLFAWVIEWDLNPGYTCRWKANKVLLVIVPTWSPV